MSLSRSRLGFESRYRNAFFCIARPRFPFLRPYALLRVCTEFFQVFCDFFACETPRAKFARATRAGIDLNSFDANKGVSMQTHFEPKLGL